MYEFGENINLQGATKEEEEKRVQKELAKIRKKFKESKETMGYDKKKYVAKIVYIFMLGYDVDFGYMEAVNLLSSNKFQEKAIVNQMSS